ncbi:MAG: VOC family protein [Candidatus Dormibacteraeota bacterium]|nr:VOC family protein [Candidatus Dormibacteraeota bacterium]
MRDPNSPALTATRLSHLGFRTPDVAEMSLFYREIVGLQLEEEEADGRVRLGWGTGHHVLELIPGRAAFDHLAFEVRDPGGAEACAERLAGSGVQVSWRPAEGSHPAVASVRDPEGNLVELHGPVDRSGEYSGDTGRRPQRVQHVTLATRAMHQVVDFYLALGFRMSDRLEDDSFIWLRSDQMHHSLAAVVARAEGALDHYSFDVGGWGDFKAWCDRLGASRVPICWGPARHGPGNNLFVMFADPDGNRVELSAELEMFWDDIAEYRPRVWKNDPWTVNLWGGTGPDWRER